MYKCRPSSTGYFLLLLFKPTFTNNRSPQSAKIRKMSFGHQDNPPNPFSGEGVQQHGFDGKHRDWSINQYERPEEEKHGNTKDLKSQSSERTGSASNDQDCKSQPRNDQNKTAKTRKCNYCQEPRPSKEKKKSPKTEDDSEDDLDGTEGLSIRLGLCCMFFEVDHS